MKNLMTNLSCLTKGTFAATADEKAVLERLKNAVKNDRTIAVDEEGVIDLANRRVVGNTMTVDMGKFFGEDKVLRTLTCGSFRALNPDQWYAKDPMLFATELKAMKRFFPGARYGFLDDGRMIWDVTVKVSKIFSPWRFTLVYEKNHPDNTLLGGSVRVIPTSPSYEELEKRAKTTGYKGVPHMLSGLKIDGTSMHFLCTRKSSDIAQGSSAAKAVSWATEWALYYELAMTDKHVWNKWCDDPHYASWKVPV